MIQPCTYKGLDALQLQNEQLSLILLPDYGGKLASLVDRKTNYEWLFQRQGELQLPSYGAVFSGFDSSGFDEIFPSINASYHPLNGKPVPDHGEVWALPWAVREIDCGLALSVSSPEFPYRLEKSLRLEANRLLIHYRAINLGDQAFAFIWTPHALLNFNAHTLIDVPDDLTDIISVTDSTTHLGAWGTAHAFPDTRSTLDKRPLNLRRLWVDDADPHCEKYYFTQPMTEGWCQVQQPDIARRLRFDFPAEKVPWLGLWKTQGGYQGDYNFALEPCTGAYDDVYLANCVGKVSQLPAQGSYEWYLHLSLSDLE